MHPGALREGRNPRLTPWAASCSWNGRWRYREAAQQFLFGVTEFGEKGRRRKADAQSPGEVVAFAESYPKSQHGRGRCPALSGRTADRGGPKQRFDRLVEAALVGQRGSQAEWRFALNSVLRHDGPPHPSESVR
ncbi:hypothetical protein GCM10010326_69080 [Streptomyces xanthochromogenes]|uniref:Integrase n=1 Tax=Streptomyces xanthochromogenes TaxID=67384 RepID=A0ABQ3AUJ0_9ACTN|nr:hypothetical protein GCM10010326_69080 [Streptomyces xanthochromogenes]